jgi:hypothetical protein
MHQPDETGLAIFQAETFKNEFSHDLGRFGQDIGHPGAKFVDLDFR